MEKTKLWSTKYFVFILFVGNFIFFSMVYLQPNMNLKQTSLVINASYINEKDYLIFTPKCMIENLDPWNKEIKPFYKKESYIQCNKYKLLTYVIKNETNAILFVDQKAAKLYSSEPVTCCYQNVTRNTKAKVPDDDIELSKCLDFENETDITNNVVIVKCHAKKEVYSNSHAPVNINEKIRAKMIVYENLSKSEENAIRPLNILFVGIDSISRLNFIRSMPKTRDFLIDTGWIEYMGYNKIGDNTFPNLMAILTGYNSTNIYKVCSPLRLGQLDKCNFIWKSYSDLGYVTAYAEDEVSINTFNYNKKGFIKPPTDYYFRSYTFAISKLKQKRVDDMSYCTGPEVTGERILNVAKDFLNTFKNHPNFGFFWMNSFSHNKLNSPTRVDVKVLQFFENLLEAGVFNNSMIIFLSDHGLRFGKVRLTHSGWLEERLPFLYFWLPKWFQQKHPTEYENLKVNGNTQLTSPYDLYMTLQHALVLFGFNYTSKPSQDCPSCKSLFQRIPSRSCEEAGINQHWCTCLGYRNTTYSDESVVKASEFIIQHVNDVIANNTEASKKCAKFSISKIVTASTLNQVSSKNSTNLVVIVKTIPEALFESTISISDGKILNGYFVSRIDSYAAHSTCTDDSNLKLYCYCK